MNENVSYLFVGGPMHGRLIAVADGISTVTVPHYADMVYHRNYWPRGGDDPNWWIRNEPEPGYVTVFEWHEVGWPSSIGGAIRDAVRES